MSPTLMLKCYADKADVGSARLAEELAADGGRWVTDAIGQLVEQIEVELVGKKLAGADQRHLRQRVELIRWLLTPAR